MGLYLKIDGITLNTRTVTIQNIKALLLSLLLSFFSTIMPFDSEWVPQRSLNKFNKQDMMRLLKIYLFLVKPLIVSIYSYLKANSSIETVLHLTINYLLFPWRVHLFLRFSAFVLNLVVMHLIHWHICCSQLIYKSSFHCIFLSSEDAAKNIVPKRQLIK